MTRQRWLTALGAVAAMAVAAAMGTAAATADVTTVDNDTTRIGWDPGEAALSPAFVGSGAFGQVFSTPVNGEVYAQPLVVGSTVIVATQQDAVYGIDALSGAITWQRSIGTPVPSSAIDPTFEDIVPVVGITATPVVDPSTNTVYVTDYTWDGSNRSSSRWFVHAMDVSTGAERPGWPVQIQGTAGNDPTSTFDPTIQNQRPGLLLMNGWVYSAYASFGDLFGYKGWIVGVNTSTQQLTLWTDEIGANQNGGIWQSGGGLMSDGPGRIFIASGNGSVPPPGPASVPSTALGNSVVRLAQQADGSLAPADRFSPSNAAQLNIEDLDVGSGAPIALPDSFGVAGHPHLTEVGGKEGRLYLLDRDNLGGEAQGTGGTDAAVAEAGPFSGVFGHPAVWPGDGGYIYQAAGTLQVLRVTTDSSGNVSLSSVASVGNGFRSMSPSVTSNGTTSGSALVWGIAQPTTGTAPGELRAWGAVPQSGTLPLVFRAPIGTATKFSVPTTNNGSVYVGTYDGHLIRFGAIPTWKYSTSQTGGVSSTLAGVASISGSDAWTVGSYKDAGGATWPLAEHWNGTSWTINVPPRGGVSSAFNGVAAVASNDVWAVGSYQDSGGATWPLSEHWTGTSWTMVVPPKGGSTSTFNAVAAVASNDVWAVGSYNGSGGVAWPLTEHWNGTSWTVIVPPSGGSTSTFTAVTAVSTGDVWASGTYTDGGGVTWPLSEHWNGTSWTTALPLKGGSSSTFTGMAAAGTADVWAVGSYVDGSNVRWPMSEHWNGTAWTMVLPARGGSTSALLAVSAVASNDVWAVGTFTDSAGTIRPLIEHWDGWSWNVVVNPLGGVGTTLKAVASPTHLSGWTVGTYTDAAGTAHPYVDTYSY